MGGFSMGMGRVGRRIEGGLISVCFWLFPILKRVVCIIRRNVSFASKIESGKSHGSYVD